jgi:hypothetical protein
MIRSPIIMMKDHGNDWILIAPIGRSLQRPSFFLNGPPYGRPSARRPGPSPHPPGPPWRRRASRAAGGCRTQGREPPLPDPHPPRGGLAGWRGTEPHPPAINLSADPHPALGAGARAPARGWAGGGRTGHVVGGDGEAGGYIYIYIYIYDADRRRGRRRWGGWCCP